MSGTINLGQIIKTLNGLSGLDITKRNRKRDYVIMRGLYYKIARENTHQPLENIGKKVNVTHCSVIHSLKFVDFDLNKEKNKVIYLKCLHKLGIKEYVKEVEIKLPKHIIEHLLNYNDYELRKLYETRMLPYKKMLDNERN